MNEFDIFSEKELLLLSWEKPVTAQLEVTKNCNQKCVFCFRDCNTKQDHHGLPIEQWMRTIKKLKNIGIRKLDFSGGESFLYSDFLSLVRWAKNDEGFTVYINTNGTVNVVDFIDYTDCFIFSVHGLNKVHDAIVKKEGSFSLVEKNIRAVSERDSDILLNMTLLKSNYHQILDVFGYFSEINPKIKFSPTIPIASRFGRGFSNHALVVNKELIREYLKKLRSIPVSRLVIKHGFQSIFINKEAHYKSGSIIFPNCAGGKNKLVIESDGSVYPCNFFKGKSFYCGNMFYDSENKIWEQGKGFIAFRNLILEEKIPQRCSICLKKKRCFSGCRAWSTNYKHGGFDYAEDLRCGLGDAFIRDRNNKQVQLEM